MLDNDPQGKLRFAALQSGAGRALLQRSGRAPEDISSIVLVEPDRSYTHSEAILRIAQYLPGPFGVLGKLGLFTPGLVRDTFYSLVAANRYNILGKKDQCRVGDERFNDRFVS
jgi:predicted DCC family thiol-disulfide oxidoreductase YuxK